MPLEHCLLVPYWGLRKRKRSTGIFGLCTWRSCWANWHHSLKRLPILSNVMLFLYETSYITLLLSSFSFLEPFRKMVGVQLCLSFWIKIWCITDNVSFFTVIGSYSGHATCFCHTHCLPKSWKLFCVAATYIIMDQWSCYWFIFSNRNGYLQGQFSSLYKFCYLVLFAELLISSFLRF